MEKYSVILTPEFKMMLNETINYYSKFSNLFSYDIIRELESACKVISYFPYIAPKFKNNENIRKVIIKDRFILIYKIKNKQVILRHFIDGRMQNNNLELNETVELIYQI